MLVRSIIHTGTVCMWSVRGGHVISKYPIIQGFKNNLFCGVKHPHIVVPVHAHASLLLLLLGLYSGTRGPAAFTHCVCI
jgi:hypothetical protein